MSSSKIPAVIAKAAAPYVAPAVRVLGPIAAGAATMVATDVTGGIAAAVSTAALTEGTSLVHKMAHSTNAPRRGDRKGMLAALTRMHLVGENKPGSTVDGFDRAGDLIDWRKELEDHPRSYTLYSLPSTGGASITEAYHQGLLRDLVVLREQFPDGSEQFSLGDEPSLKERRAAKKWWNSPEAAELVDKLTPGELNGPTRPPEPQKAEPASAADKSGTEDGGASAAGSKPLESAGAAATAAKDR